MFAARQQKQSKEKRGLKMRDNGMRESTIQLMEQWAIATRQGDVFLEIKRPAMTAIATKGGATANITAVDENTIDSAMAVLAREYPPAAELIIDVFIYGHNNSEIAKNRSMNRKEVGSIIDSALSHIEGALCTVN